MKKLLLMSLLVSAAAFSVNAQEKDKMKVDQKDVPQAVKTAFETQFANAANVEWKMKEGKYKTKFTQDGVKQMAEMNATGELISKSTKVENEELPTPVADAVKANYSSNKIEEVYRVEKGDQTHYLVKMDGTPEKKVVFDANGKVIKD